MQHTTYNSWESDKDYGHHGEQRNRQEINFASLFYNTFVFITIFLSDLKFINSNGQAFIGLPSSIFPPCC